MNALEQAERLKNELDNLRPLNAEAEARIMQKFRLDWNYHSNNIEGNSLTYGETKALILFGITAQGKPLKDHFEITGHNEAINWVIDLVKGETELTEHFIRQLHVLLLKEDHYIDAITSEGVPTRRLVKVGTYKTMPNHVQTVTGEMFYFANPEETSSKMYDLIEWFRKEREKLDVNTIILAALFHYRFIRIHPFDDGNGRVARILMNFILMQFGYPPVIIKTEDKENYYAVLRLADADELEPFIEYIAQNLMRSLEIMIRGAKGESIEEPDDLDKELALLEGRLKGNGEKITVIKSQKALLELIDNSLIPLFKEFVKSCEKFDRFYVNKQVDSKLNGMLTSQDTFESINLSNLKSKVKTIYHYDSIQLFYEHLAFNRDKVKSFNHLSSIYISLLKTCYRIKSKYIDKNNDSVIFEKLYSESLTNEEIQILVKDISKKHLEFLEQKTQKSN